MKSVHVLIIGHATTVGGAERSLEALVRAMPASRCRYTVALPAAGPLADLLRRQQIPTSLVRHEGWRWWTRSLEQSMKFWITSPLQAVSLIRWLLFIRSVRPDVVHCNVSRLVEPMLAARILRVPMVVHFRDIPSLQRHRFIPGRKMFYRLMNLADVWMANSCATADDIRPACRRPLFIVPNGLELATFDREAHAHADEATALLRPFRYHIGMIGGLNPTKRQSDFIEAALLVTRERRDVAFYVVGGDADTEYAAQLRARVQAAGASANVRFLGPISCVPSLMCQLDIIAHATPHEGFGRIFLEAMAARRPVVAVASGGAVDVVLDGQTGVLVPPRDVARMAAELSALLDDEPRRRAMGESGRSRVEVGYTMSQHCDAVANIYEMTVFRSNRAHAK